nr:PREDICTED: uncharacterized protein LOC109039636 [Bemisia tabaci]
MRRLGLSLTVAMTSLATHVTSSLAGLTLERRCGEDKLVCPKYNYCSQNEFCSPCQKICDKNDNNYSPTLCETQCQDYIHDYVEHYVHSAASINDQNIEELLRNLYLLVACTLIISVIVLGTVVGALTLYYIRYRKRTHQHLEFEEKAYQKKLATAQYVSTINNNRNPPEPAATTTTTTSHSIAHNQVAPISTITPIRGDHPLRLDMPVNSRSYQSSLSVPTNKTGTPPSANTTTTSITTKYPSEDRTLEYVYDNLALTPSPVLNKETSTSHKIESRL